jgi:hypothetical protein
MNKKYVVKLMEAERTVLQKLIATGKAAARKLLHTRVLLKVDLSSQGSCWSVGEISEALEVSPATIQRVCQQFVEQGLTAALERRLPRGQRIRRLDGEGEAHLIALMCSSVPTGHNRWTIRLLAKKLVVMDNLNTHDFSSMYETFEPQEPRRIREKLEIHCTPKHGSWLNMAEVEQAVLSGQCLDRRIGQEAEPRQEVTAWEAERNDQQARVNWRFTTQDACIKLKHLYPVLEKGSDCGTSNAERIKPT